MNAAFSIRRRTAISAIVLLAAGWLIAGSASGQGVRLGGCEDVLSVSVRSVSIQSVLNDLVARCDLRIIQQKSLDEVVTLRVEQQPLSVVIGRLLRDKSYQLYQRMPDRNDASTDRPANILWIFDTGIAVVAAAVEYLETEIMNGDARERLRAVKALKLLGSEEAISPLSLALADDDQKVQVEAIHALASIGGEDALAALASAAADDHAWVRGEAVNALASIGGDSAAQYLDLAMQDADSNVRANVVQAYAEAGGYNATQALTLALLDPDPAVRMEAIEALGDVGGDAALQALFQAKSDPDPEIQEAARESIELLKNQR